MDRQDIYKGIDAKIVATKQRIDGSDPGAYVTRCRWEGGDLAAISDELMAEIAPNVAIGDVIHFGDLLLTITDYNGEAEFWYVRRAE